MAVTSWGLARTLATRAALPLSPVLSLRKAWCQLCNNSERTESSSDCGLDLLDQARQSRCCLDSAERSESSTSSSSSSSSSCVGAPLWASLPILSGCPHPLSVLVLVLVLVGVVVAVSREERRAWSSSEQIQSMQPVAPTTTTTATACHHALKAAVPFQQSHLCAVSKMISQTL